MNFFHDYDKIEKHFKEGEITMTWNELLQKAIVESMKNSKEMTEEISTLIGLLEEPTDFPIVFDHLNQKLKTNYEAHDIDEESIEYMRTFRVDETKEKIADHFIDILGNYAHVMKYGTAAEQKAFLFNRKKDQELLEEAKEQFEIWNHDTMKLVHQDDEEEEEMMLGNRKPNYRVFSTSNKKLRKNPYSVMVRSEIFFRHQLLVETERIRIMSPFYELCTSLNTKMIEGLTEKVGAYSTSTIRENQNGQFRK